MDFQGFRRLKKLQPELFCKQLTSTADIDPSRHLNSISGESKEASVGLSRANMLKGRSGPISIKFKKAGTEGSSKDREFQRDQRHQNEVGKTPREPPRQIEIGAKRLKVKGPSVLGYEGRLS